MDDLSSVYVGPALTGNAMAQEQRMEKIDLPFSGPTPAKTFYRFERVWKRGKILLSTVTVMCPPLQNCKDLDQATMAMAYSRSLVKVPIARVMISRLSQVDRTGHHISQCSPKDLQAKLAYSLQDLF